MHWKVLNYRKRQTIRKLNTTEERIDLMAASTAYQANLTALGIVKSLALKSLEIGK